jgi:hypothetical protein
MKTLAITSEQFKDLEDVHAEALEMNGRINLSIALSYGDSWWAFCNPLFNSSPINLIAELFLLLHSEAMVINEAISSDNRQIRYPSHQAIVAERMSQLGR